MLNSQLGVSQLAVFQLAIADSVLVGADVLTFVEINDTLDVQVAGSDSLVISEVDVVDVIDTGTDTLALTEADASIDSATDTLNLTEVGVVVQPDSDSLSLSEVDDVQLIWPGNDTLVLTESSVEKWIFHVAGTDVLQSIEEVFDPDTLQITQVQVGLTESDTVTLSVIDTETRNDSDTLSFVENDVAIVCTNRDVDFLLLNEVGTLVDLTIGGDTLTLGESHSCVVNSNVSDSDTLSLVESAVCIYIEANPTCSNEYSYSPQVGSSTALPTPPPTTYQAASGTTGYRLQYPATGLVSDDLRLDNPNFGNLERVVFNRANTNTRGGDHFVFADPAWPKYKEFVASFSNLKRDKAFALLQFIDDHLGLPIKLIDHEDREWVGVITVANDPIVEDTRGRYTGSFAFQTI